MSTSKKKASQISAAVIQAAISVIFYTVVVMIFFIAVKKAYAFGYEVFQQQAVSEAPGMNKVFVVEEDMSASECMEALEQSGLIRSRTVALIQEFFFEYDIYPGTYTLNTSMTTKEILAELNEKPVEEIPEKVSDVPAAASAATEAQVETKEIIEGDD